MKLTTRSLLRIVAVAAIALAVVNCWPRSLPRQSDGSVTWYRGLWGSRKFYRVTGTDSLGCSFEATLSQVPEFAKVVGEYPDGTQREEATVWVTGSIGGATVHRKRVRQGVYFAPDGKKIGEVKDGTGNVRYSRPNGVPIVEYILDEGEVVLERRWWKNGNLQCEIRFQDGIHHGESVFFYPSGKMRSRSFADYGATTEVEYFDKNGVSAESPDRLIVNGNL